MVSQLCNKITEINAFLVNSPSIFLMIELTIWKLILKNVQNRFTAILYLEPIFSFYFVIFARFIQKIRKIIIGLSRQLLIALVSWFSQNHSLMMKLFHA